ncbi:SCO1431 family membrane protein [Streptomyces sp. UNOC14_S4]|uniref:SCO1431 family membrane protein n=1 Tax=Streptomyces sp. UNOC14_S4 TaxID=2872340 RepID=UPI001E658CA3|nr:SCO1431 family membrane protein [Streptomyces sp. UNOC14_S4]MCC3772112.1 SCO1431 family membrane protein [Streptomyces sp. UNOC14_S4]
MTETAAVRAARTHTRTRTGGPSDDGNKLFEHIAGWTLTVVIAMLITQLGLV